MGEVEFQTLASPCEENNLPIGLLTELFDAEKRQYGMSRRSMIFSDIDRIFKKDWRSQKQVFENFELGIQQDH